MSVLDLGGIGPCRESQHAAKQQHEDCVAFNHGCSLPRGARPASGGAASRRSGTQSERPTQGVLSSYRIRCLLGVTSWKSAGRDTGWRWLIRQRNEFLVIRIRQLHSSCFPVRRRLGKAVFRSEERRVGKEW